MQTKLKRSALRGGIFLCTVEDDRGRFLVFDGTGRVVEGDQSTFPDVADARARALQAFRLQAQRDAREPQQLGVYVA